MRPSSLGPLLACLGVLVLGVSVTALVWHDEAAARQKDEFSRFNALTERATAELTRRVGIFQYGLRGARGAVISAGIDTTTRADFLRYSQSRNIAQEFPGALGFGYVRLVAPQDSAGPVAPGRRDDLHGASSQGSDGLAAERMVIRYFQPTAAAPHAIGLDIARRRSLRQAAMQAIRDGLATLSGPIGLSRLGGDNEQGLVFLLPVYRPGSDTATPQERMRAAAGLAYAPLLINRILRDIPPFQTELAASVYDVGPPARRVPLFVSQLAAFAPPDGLSRQVALNLYGSHWLVNFKATPAFVRNLDLPSPQRSAAAVAASFALLASLTYVILLNARQRRRAALRDSSLAAIVKGASDAIIGKDLRGRITSWNPAAVGIFGYPEEEALGRTVAELIVPPDRQDEETSILEQLGRGEPVARFITKRSRRDGTLIDVSVTVSPVRDAHGTVVGAAKTVRDVTQEIHARRRLAELNATLEAQVSERTAQLAANERFLQSVIDQMPGLVGYWDTNLRCRFANKSYEDWFGRSRQQILQISSRDLLGDDLFQQSEPFIRGALRGESQTMERTITKPDGTVMHTLVHFLSDIDQGVVRGYIVVATDISQIKHAEEALIEAKKKAEDATAAKSAFLATMSHEIRTPMNAIIGLCYLLERQDLRPVTREMVSKIHGASRALLGIINDILDFSKIEARRLDLEDVPFRLSEVLDNLASIMSASLGSKPLELVVTPAPAGADFLRGDGLRLGQVLTNLAGNAIKFTAQGEVSVHVERLPAATADRVLLRFSVRDTGIGIAKDKQRTIFQAFSQADGSTTRSYGGTGLGLSISSRLVDMMGGTLTVESETGRGSTFSFVLPFQRSEPAQAAIPEMAHLRVLVADDHATARDALRDTVTSLGWNADAVDSGMQAVAQATSTAAPSYDVVLLDWRMPGLDGLQAAARIRRVGNQEGAPILVMVTAFDRDELRRQEGSECVDAIINKPVTSSSLYNAVLEAKRRLGQFHLATGLPAQLRRLDGLRLLIVDDSEINRDVAKGILSAEGAEIELVEDGKAALDILAREPAGFDAVLMDMQMPVMDGYEATRQIRANQALTRLPVIALTAGAFRSQRDQAMVAGVDAFVAKPFEVEELIHAVVHLVHGRGVSVDRSKDGPSSLQGLEGSTERGGNSSPEPSPRILDVQRGLRIWGDADALGSSLRKFLAIHGDAVAGMRTATPEAASRLAHRLKGAAAQLGVDVVADIAAQAEQRLAGSGDASGILDRLEVAMSAASAAIENYAAGVRDAAPQRIARDAVRGEDIAATLSQLLQTLDDGDVGAAETAVQTLAQALPSEQLSPLRSALASYDLRAAESTVREIARACNVNLDG